ncbi:MAG: hypothetical protein ACFFCS_25800 [Candidatus Hodarchaeota archaeon]
MSKSLADLMEEEKRKEKERKEKQKQAREQKKVQKPKESPGVLVETIKAEVIPALHSINSTLSAFKEQPLKLDVSALKVELVATSGTGAITAVERLPEASKRVSPPVLHQGAVKDLPTALTMIMDLRRKKWRPRELLTEVVLRYPDLPCSEDTIKDELERLSGSSRVVKLSTRYISKGHFSMLDEISFVDISILKILEDVNSSPSAVELGPTSIHKKLISSGVVKISLPTLLNHLRVLKTPGWELIKKTGDALRDGYVITREGSSFLALVQDKIKKNAKLEPNWTNLLGKWKIQDEKGILTKKGEFIRAIHP